MSNTDTKDLQTMVILKKMITVLYINLNLETLHKKQYDPGLSGLEAK